jgi:hypothetical protein
MIVCVCDCVCVSLRTRAVTRACVQAGYVGIGGFRMPRRAELARCVEDIDLDFTVRSPWMSAVVAKRAADAAPLAGSPAGSG